MAYQRSTTDQVKHIAVGNKYLFHLRLVVIALFSLCVTFGSLAAEDETQSLPMPRDLQQQQENLHRLQSCERMIGFTVYTGNLWNKKNSDLHVAMTALYSCMKIKEMIGE